MQAINPLQLFSPTLTLSVDTVPLPNLHAFPPLQLPHPTLDESIPKQASKPSHLVPGVPSANWHDLVTVVGALVKVVGAFVGAFEHLSTSTSVH
jgi:hypothetical protein